MARKRKNRTHLKGVAPTTATTADGVPKSFIIKHGQVGSSLTQLVRDIRKVMEPNTASRLKVCLSYSSLVIPGEKTDCEQRNGIGTSSRIT